MKHWTKHQIHAFSSQLFARVGAAWSMLGPDLREALIAEKAFAVCRAQQAPHVLVDAMDELIREIRHDMGVA